MYKQGVKKQNSVVGFGRSVTFKKKWRIRKSSDATVRRVDEQQSVVPTTLVFGGVDTPLSPLL
jgi:hypothetical protein